MPESLFTPPSTSYRHLDELSPTNSELNLRNINMREETKPDPLLVLRGPDAQEFPTTSPDELDEETLEMMLKELKERFSDVAANLRACKQRLALARARSQGSAEELPDYNEDSVVESDDDGPPKLETASTVIAKLRKENRDLRLQLSKQHSEMQELTVLQDTRAQELHSYQSFLSKADEFSVLECIQTVKALNAEIEQSCASIADTVTANTKLRTIDDRQLKKRERFVRKHTRNGEALASWIAANRQQEDPAALLQFCLQQALTAMFSDQILDWAWQDTRRRYRIVENIYLAMQQRGTKPTCLHCAITQCYCIESQSVAGRWRTLTRAQTKPKDERVFERMRQDIFSLIETFIEAHGWSLDADNLKSLIKVRVDTFQKLIVDAESMLGQGLRTVDLRPFFADPGIQFDSMFMEDAEGGSLPQQPVQIAFSTGLGVQMYNADTKEHSVLLKTKVQLLSTIDAVLGSG